MCLEWNSLGLPFAHFMGKFKLGQYGSQLLGKAFTLPYIRYIQISHPNTCIPTSGIEYAVLAVTVDTTDQSY